MPNPSVQLPSQIPAPLAEGIANLRGSLGIPGDFSADALAEAEQAAASQPVIGKDMTDIPFITIDPASSLDLDQAMHIVRRDGGYTVHYAIANVAAWVKPGGALDEETHARGCTYYAPNNNVPLHPTVLSHGAASLLADGVARPAYVWTLELDATGEVTSAIVERAMVKNTAKLDYEGCQADLDAGRAIETIVLLKEVGLLREALEVARGGISLPIPEQVVTADGDTWVLEYRTPLPIEGWNAQISLMTGMAAAQLMMTAKVGILRTLPPSDAASIGRLRRAAKALHIDWPKGMPYPAFVRSLDPSKSSHKAMLNQCTRLFGGAGYMSFHGELPAEDCKHNALACYYAHTTAPLRRLVDRFVLEICACISAAEPVPAWCTDALEALPLEMEACDKREKKYTRGIVDMVEALVLQHRVGETFHATVLESDGQRGQGVVLLDDPAVEGVARGRLPFGGEVEVKLTGVDMTAGKVFFEAAGGARAPRDGRRPARQQHDDHRPEQASQHDDHRPEQASPHDDGGLPGKPYGR